MAAFDIQRAKGIGRRTMKSILSVGVAALGLVSMLGIAGASLRNVPPAQFGAPFVGGASSFDYTNWSYADNVLNNGAGTDRTWTVSIQVDNADANVSESVYGVIANSATGTTSGQVVTNYGGGGRLTSLAPVSATTTTLTDRFLGSAVVPVDGTFYVNYVVGRSGGKIARTQINQ
jgi:hypothetical protein